MTPGGDTLDWVPIVSKDSTPEEIDAMVEVLVQQSIDSIEWAADVTAQEKTLVIAKARALMTPKTRAALEAAWLDLQR